MNSFMIIVAAALLVMVFSARRLIDVKAPYSMLGWLVLILAFSAPLATGWRSLNPGQSVDTLSLEEIRKSGKLDIPAGHVILATGELIEASENEDEVDISKQLTRYALDLTGEGWNQSIAGVVYRVAKAGASIDPDGRAGIQSTGGFRLWGTGKDFQTRFWPIGQGQTEIKATTWDGQAITALRLDVVPSPPPQNLIWPVVIALGVLALVSDTFLGSDHLAIDIGFLAFPCYFITQEVTPESGLREVIFALSSGALVGGLSLGFAGYILERIFHKPVVAPPKVPPAPAKVAKP